ncbi:MAG TPA: DUF4349 domain-containing protein [Chthoniobacterales bacterium]|jgi:anti-sigma factor RsiW
MTVHDDIYTYLAADLHSELSDDERNALHAHLVECAACRKLHQETKTMNKILEENLATEKPDPAFEQRMLASFRTRIPQTAKGGLAKLIVDLMRLRAAQITAVAAVLLALVQVGRMVTGESPAPARKRGYIAEEKLEAQIANAPFAPSGAANELAADSRRAEGRSDFGTRTKSNVAPAAPAAAADHFADQKFDEVREVVAAAKSAKGKEAAAAGQPEEQNTETLELRNSTAASQAETPPAAAANRKLIRNANVEIELASFDDAVQKITGFAKEDGGYVATTSSNKQANGKLRGEIVVKVLPENLDRFLQKIRGLGELKNQTLGTEDITRAYFDTDARLKNARVMEQRLIDMLKKKSEDINDLLQVEKELARVREQIEQMQGELKFWDSQVQFATVTIALAEKDMEEPAAFLIKERAQLALYTPDVEKIYNDIKALASPKTQITNAQLNRDNSGQVSAHISVLIAPEESDPQIARIKAMGRVENFQVQTERVAQGGTGMSENAKTKRDKVELNITISREEQEQAFQQTSLRIRTSAVDEKSKELKTLAQKHNGRVRSSTFSRDPNGREFASVSLRVPMKNYPALMESLNALGKVENVSVQRQDRTDAQIDEANAPADLSIQVYSQGNIVSQQSGLLATLRRTISQSAAAIMWSLRMIGVAIAFLAPWVIALVALIWMARRVTRARRKL